PHCPPANLPSFPTRRSSDLAGKLANIDIAVTVDGDAVRRGELAGGETGVHLAEPGQHLALGRMNADTRPDIGPVAVDLPGGTALDRKSTRLNSSHVSISYAV